MTALTSPPGRPRRAPRAHRSAVRVTVSLLAAAGLLASYSVAASGAGAGYAAVQQTNVARPVPAGASLLPSGRLVSPAGRSFGLGDFPEGLAVSPDGTLAVASGVGQGEGTGHGDFGGLCVNGLNRNPCPPSRTLLTKTLGPDEGLFVTNLRTGAYAVLRFPAARCNPASATPSAGPHCFEFGVAFAPDGRTLYATGGGNDAVYAFPVSAADAVAAAPSHVTYLQEINAVPGGTGSYQKPNPGTQAGRTKGMAVTPDGSTLLVTKEQAGTLDLLDARTLAFKQEISFGAANPTGANGSVTYPYDVRVAPNGGTAYVTLQGVGALASVPLLPDPRGGKLAGTAVYAPVGDHPTGLAVSADGATALVTNANDDTVSVLTLRSGLPQPPAVSLPVAVRPQLGYGAVPNAVTFASPDTAYVALAGDDAVAVLHRTAGRFVVAGFEPVGWYPTAVAVRPGTGELLAVSAKGLGSRFTAHGEYPAPAVGGPQADLPGVYDGDNMPGLLSVLPAPTPSAAALAGPSAVVARDLAFADAGGASAAGPVPDAAHAGQSPITHVVYIVRENRTYDQVYGDLARVRNDVDADPRFNSLATATPAGHALVGRYASSDSFFSDGEASVQGHYWTTSANVDDYVEKSWRQYYSARNHSSDSVGTTISQPRACSVFQAALAKQTDPTSPHYNPAFTWMDFGDPVGVANASIAPGAAAGSVPAAVGSTGAGRTACAAVPAAAADLTNFGNFLGLDDRQSVSRFLSQSGLSASGAPLAGSTAVLRNFNYLELPNDHTTGFTAQGPTNVMGHTPRAQIAENDAAVGQVVAALSHSPYWSSTAVFAVEDDSQDGPDHVDGHRNVLLVASPYARQVSANGCYGGYISHTHYDQASVLHTIELMLGLPPLSAYDAGARPLTDLFQPVSSASALSAAALRPFTPPPGPAFLEEKVGSASAGSAAAQAALRAASAHLNLTARDLAGPQLERVLAASVRAASDPAASPVLLPAAAGCGATVPGGAAAVSYLAAPAPPSAAAGSAPRAAQVSGERLATTGWGARGAGIAALLLLLGAVLTARQARAERVRRVVG